MRDFERTGRNIDGIDVGVRKRMRGENGEAARARAQFEHGTDFVGVGHVRLQPVVE